MVKKQIGKVFERSGYHPLPIQPARPIIKKKTASYLGVKVGNDTEKEYLIRAIKAFRRRFVVVSPDYHIIAVNRSDDALCKADIIGKLCYEVFYGRTSPCENCAVKEAVETGGPALRPKPDDTIDLSRMPCYYAYPIDDGNKIEAFVSMDFDLLTTGGLEEKLQHSNALLRNLLQSAVDGVIAADMKGKIFIFNDSAVEVFGYSAEEALTRLNVKDIYPDHTAHEVMKALRSEKYGGPGKLKTYHVDILAKNGQRIPISLYASIVYEEDREVATIGFFHDLRERIRMRKELEKTRIQVLQAEKMVSLGKLAAGVAHQLNNPLGGIILFTKLIMEEYDLEDGARADLTRILKDAQRCRDTVRELLEFTRQTRHLLQPHDINRAISRTLFLLESQALFQNIEIIKNLSESLPPARVDIQQINHVFMNIILNAAQAMAGKGTLTLSTYVSPGGDRACIEITDTGPGIPDDVLPHIFEPFYTTKEEGKGTGLGLSLVYGIVEDHGGRIKALSKPGEGATFIIEIPLARSANKGDESE